MFVPLRTKVNLVGFGFTIPMPAEADMLAVTEIQQETLSRETNLYFGECA